MGKAVESFAPNGKVEENFKMKKRKTDIDSLLAFEGLNHEWAMSTGTP